mmetsp:Transcript_52004/g.116699  ORF Transcript_52004/g.116699 Transcript_52004/m.116699 type:complete len:896 (-) Transcript_52004:56-2743(-)
MTSQALEATAIRHLAVTQSQLHTVCEEEFQFEGATTVAQIFQGVAFMALAIMLIFMNNAKIGAGSKAPLEVRYATAITISIAVCLFSGFFNILQMTGIDNFDLPRSTNFTLDLSRPVEWLLTCPVMQLILVILGGARIPGYRKFMMPLLTAGNLLCGVAAMFSEGGMQWAWFAFGFMLWSTYTFYNVQQIIENSDGDEGLLHGDSDYRKLSVITIFTWFPFPLWFIVSPEGVGLIQDAHVIQLGWAVLNVVSKFGFILHLQYIKNKYCRTLDATRELYGVSPGGEIPQAEKEKTSAWGDGEGGDDEDDKNGEKKIVTLVTETMISIGMSSHTDRFLRLILDNGIVSTDILERLTQDRAMDLNLPWSLCDAVQRRWKAEKLNLGQDKGGVIEKEDPFKKLLAEGKARRELKSMYPGFPGLHSQFDTGLDGTGTNTPPFAGGAMPMISDGRIASIEMRLADMMAQLEAVTQVMQTVANKVEHFDNSQEAICQRLDFAQQAQLQTLNSSQVLLHKIDSAQEDVVNKVTEQKHLMERVKSGQELILETLTGSSDSAKKDLLDSMENSSKALLRKLDTSQQELLTKQGEQHEILVSVNKSQGALIQKIDINAETAARRSVEQDSSLERKLTDMRKEVVSTCDNAITQISKNVSTEMRSLATQNASTTELLQNGMSSQEERMADVRRQNMMIMDMLSGTQERVMQSADSIQSFTRLDLAASYQLDQAKIEVEMRNVVANEMAHMRSELETIMLGSDAHDHEGGRVNLAQLFASAAERLECAAKQFESKVQDVKAGETAENQVEEVVRREIAAAAMALAQQQREIAEQHVGQVRDEVAQSVRGELKETTQIITSKVDKFEGTLDQGLDRIEQGVTKALASAPASKGEEKGESRRRSAGADRG